MKHKRHERGKEKSFRGFRVFRGYQKYKNSGVEWLGDVPEHWEIKKFKYCVSLVTKRAENSSDIPIALENIESWTGRFIETESAFEGEGVSFQANDILFGKLRPYLAKVYLAEEKGKSVGDIFVLRPDKKTTPRYVTNVLRTKNYIEIIDGSTYGSKMPRASWEFMGGLQFPLPPLPEQQAIASFLDRETERIDALIAKKERLLELLAEQRTALISAVVTGKVDVSNLEKHDGDEKEVYTFRGFRAYKKYKNSGVEWLGDVPEHWKVKRAGLAYSIQLGKMLQPDASSPDDEQIEYLKALHVQWEKVQTNDLPSMWASRSDLLKYSVEKGDLLVCEGGEVGRAGIIKDNIKDVIIQNSLHRVRSKENLNSFLMYVLKDASSKNWFDILCNKATIAHFTGDKFSALLIPLPPLPEQKTIAAFLDYETGKIDALSSKIHSAIERLKEYRTALISAAVTGKIDLREAG